MRRSRPALLGFILIVLAGGALVVVSHLGTDKPASPPLDRLAAAPAAERSENGLQEGDALPSEVKGAAVVILFATDDKTCEKELSRWKELDEAARRRGYIPRGGILDRNSKAAILRLQAWGVGIASSPCSPTTGQKLLGSSAALPTLFLVGPDGRIQARLSGAGSFTAAIRRLSGTSDSTD